MAFTKKQIQAFIQEYKTETGETLTKSQAVALMDRTEEHANEADAGEPGSGAHVPTDEEARQMLGEVSPVLVARKVIAVKSGQKLRGARAAWYERLVEFNGKPVAEFVASCTADPPATYGARSKHAGQAEPVQGWVRFFVRTGVLVEVDSL